MRIGIVSDIHANLPALDAVLAALGEIDALWQLGDVVGYGPHPDEVVARLRERGAIGVRGNHDAAALGSATVEHFNSAARQAIAWTRGRMSAETRAWLAAQPERRLEGDVTLVHGSPRDPIWEYVFTEPVARPSFDAFDTSWCLHGHTHYPAAWILDGADVSLRQPEHGEMVRLDEGRLLVNPGSVGQPRDGDPRASAIVLDTERGTLTWLRVPYPIAEVQAAMRAARLPAMLVERLEWGR
jgi:diadenosine tetraphosphatase ApaH/serine/threonine PP2A family protein phosphatase